LTCAKNDIWLRADSRCEPLQRGTADCPSPFLQHRREFLWQNARDVLDWLRRVSFAAVWFQRREFDMAFSKEVVDAVTAAAQAEGLEPAALLAVVEVESNGQAFTTIDGRPMPLILYEYHVFYRWDGLNAAERKEAVNRKLAAPRWGDLPYMKSPVSYTHLTLPTNREVYILVVAV